MHGEGWRRLWETAKVLASIAGAAWVVMMLVSVQPLLPAGSTPSASQIATGFFLSAVVSGGAVYLALSTLQWLWEGFRPKPTNPTEEADPDPQAEPSDTALTPAGKLEHHPALPHPEIQQMNERQQQR